MKGTPELMYNGQIDTHQEVKELFRDISLQDRQNLCNDISPVLYQFHAVYENAQSTVFRTHDEIVKFVKKYNKKAKQLKEPYTVNFQKIKNQQILKQISQLNDIAQQTWFKQFFDLCHKIPGKKISINLKKQSGGRYTQRKCCLCLKWKKCRGYVLNDGIVTYDQSKGKIQQFLHFGKDFTWQVSPQIKQNEIYIHSNHRKMTLSAPSTKQFFIFTYCLDKYLKAYNKQQKQYPFNSFAPIRYNNQVQFYVDGSQYFQAVALAIESAAEEVFICGWWVSPQFSLIRPCTGTNLDYRLDNLLAKTAKKGVKIYIIVYYESSFLTNDSAYTIEALQSLHQNIKVLRHPQIVFPTFWSHHQKLIVIDQFKAFMGGLDICYGRYDNQLHLINQSSIEFYPGIQYNNCRIADFVQVRQFTRQNIPRHLPRLPWHDVTLMVRGKCVKDLSRHFIQYWNYSSYQTHFADRYVLVSQSNKIIPKKKGGLFQNIKDFANQIKDKIGSSQKQKTIHIQKQLNQPQRIYNKKDMIKQQNITQYKQSQKNFSFTNPFSKLFQSKQQKNEKKIVEQQINEVMVRKQSPTNQILFSLGDKKSNQVIEIDEIDFDINKNHQQFPPIQQEQFQERQYERIKKTQQFEKMRMDQIKKIQVQIEENDQINQEIQKKYIRQKQQKQKNVIQSNQRISTRIINKAKTITQKIFNRAQKKLQYDQKKSSMFKEDTNMKYTCQVLRSASTWSIGCKQFQRSIQDAYIELIEQSKKFIYIQNQFFISATHQKGAVKNKIMQALSKRIIKAIQSGQNFRVMVLMPLIPGFAGELDDPAASLPRVIMNWQYKTISRGQDSLLGRISNYTKEPQKYVQFYSLRTHGLINEEPVTEIIYLHSKLMIVDDRSLICGSANINDRSMEGNRDSQLCLLVQGNNDKDIYYGKQKFRVLDIIHRLRTRLWQEHFGIPQFKARNFMDEELWWQINKIARQNTDIYRRIFGCYPDQEIKKLISIRPFKKQKFQKKLYDQEAYKIQGHVVIFPLSFLQDQKLTSYHPNAIST